MTITYNREQARNPNRYKYVDDCFNKSFDKRFFVESRQGQGWARTCIPHIRGSNGPVSAC